jgi:hypothetical protein
MIRRLLARMGSDAGMTTAEYAVGTVIPERYLGSRFEAAQVAVRQRLST